MLIRWNVSGTLQCLLCKGVVTFVNGDKSKFENHMQADHDAYFNHNLMLAINYLDKNTLKEIVTQFEDNLRAMADKRKVESDVKHKEDTGHQNGVGIHPLPNWG